MKLVLSFLQYSQVNTVVVDDLYLQLKVVRGASLSQALRLQVHMMDDLKETRRNYRERLGNVDKICKCEFTNRQQFIRYT